MKILLYLIICMVAMSFMSLVWLLDDPPANIVKVPVVVVEVQDITQEPVTLHRGYFTYTPDKPTQGSSVRLQDGSIAHASGMFARDIGHCEVGQSAFANVRIGIFSHRLWEVVGVVC